MGLKTLEQKSIFFVHHWQKIRIFYGTNIILFGLWRQDRSIFSQNIVQVGFVYSFEYSENRFSPKIFRAYILYHENEVTICVHISS